MANPQIRINKTKELQEIFDNLGSLYKGMSEAEIMKMALAEFYMVKMNLRIDPYDAIDRHPDDDPNEEWETLVDFTKGGTKSGIAPEQLTELLDTLDDSDNG